MTPARVWVTFQKPGFHRWPDGPDYLAEKHRHLFHITVSAHSYVNENREIEFHELLKSAKIVWRDIAVRNRIDDYGTQSCEQLAWAMAKRLARVWNCPITVDVSEDGECGATVTDEWTHHHAYTGEEERRSSISEAIDRPESA